MLKSVFTLLFATLYLFGCSDSGDDASLPLETEEVVEPTPVPADESTVYKAANGCYAITVNESGTYLTVTESGASYAWSEMDADGAAQFRLRPTDLGSYVLYDNGYYLTGLDEGLARQASLASDTNEVDGKVVIEDRMQSEGEWLLQAAEDGLFRLQHIKSGAWLTSAGNLAQEDQAALLGFEAQNNCADFPELSLDAQGDIAVTEFDDGTVYGFVESHSHLFTNLAFGGGGVFHGAPYHPLGVQHALPDCDLVHGEGGRKDFMGSSLGGSAGSITDLLPALVSGELPEKTHDTDGYPAFTSWPDAHRSSTHQVQYYKWLERAYLGGLRLLVQHATTNEVLCQLVVGIGAQPKRFDCNDMVSVDRIIEDTYALERYIDALSGGPGEGWFRIVFSPEEAREQIKSGNLAVVLGIEASDLFDCFLVPFGEFQACTEEDVVAKLDHYYGRGVRVMFPVHKYDNAFSAGDGHRGIIEIGNFLHTGHTGNLVECSPDLLEFNGGFDSGGVTFSSFNQPREVFDSTPPVDVSEFDADPLNTMLANIGYFVGGPIEGEYCQNHGLTPLGEFLIQEMMKRGMVVEVDHLPRKSYKRTFELLVENDYPAMGTHGRNNNGLLYELGGMSKFNFGRCRSGNETSTMDNDLQARLQMMRDVGAFPAEGFGFDLNGFAGSPGPRFGDNSVCSEPQTDAGITYPFTSFAGDVTFDRPQLGDRVLDFNTEGMVHLGLVAELIEDVRRDGATDEDLEPLFKSAEKYLRVWEKSEARGAQLSQ